MFPCVGFGVVLFEGPNETEDETNGINPQQKCWWCADEMVKGSLLNQLPWFGYQIKKCTTSLQNKKCTPSLSTSQHCLHLKFKKGSLFFGLCEVSRPWIVLLVRWFGYGIKDVFTSRDALPAQLFTLRYIFSAWHAGAFTTDPHWNVSQKNLVLLPTVKQNWKQTYHGSLSLKWLATSCLRLYLHR